MLEKRPYLHNIYYKNSSVLEFCPSCVLKLNPGKFCPICFSVYENEDPNYNPPAVCCSMCSAMAHVDCVMHTSTSPSSSSSSYDPTANFVCRSCSDPEFNFFDWKEGERIDLRGMDMGLEVQLVAASFISGRSMKDGADRMDEYENMDEDEYAEDERMDEEPGDEENNDENEEVDDEDENK